jgi:hypothetical protein
VFFSQFQELSNGKPKLEADMNEETDEEEEEEEGDEEVEEEEKPETKSHITPAMLKVHFNNIKYCLDIDFFITFYYFLSLFLKIVF